MPPGRLKAQPVRRSQPHRRSRHPRDSRPSSRSTRRASPAALRSLVPDVVAEPRGNTCGSWSRGQLEAAARRLRDNLAYALLSMVTAVDYPDRIEVVYLAFALEHPHGVELRTVLPREDLPDCPSLTSVWPGAEFQEREVYDLMGINFVGHPDLRRILTEDDFPGASAAQGFLDRSGLCADAAPAFWRRRPAAPAAEGGTRDDDRRGDGVDSAGPAA